MRLLLDTHVFLWYISADPRLPVSWRAILRDPANDVFISSVSVWEASIKFHLGKLPLPGPAEVYLPEQRERHRFLSIALDERDLTPMASLPDTHRDPFDRALVCQALANDLTLVTNDLAVRSYSVDCLPMPE